MKKKLQHKTQVKETFFKNPIMETLKKLYPDRDYEVQFDLMIDWYESQKGRMPQTISAFANWLAKSKPDEAMRGERLRTLGAEETNLKLKQMQAVPRASAEKVQEMRQRMKSIGKPMEQPKPFTSREELEHTLITVMIILKTGEHIKGTNYLYGQLHTNPTKKFKNKEGIVFSGENVLKYVPIDDYKKE